MSRAADGPRGRLRRPQIEVMLSLKRLMAHRDEELILATGKPIKSKLQTVVMRS